MQGGVDLVIADMAMPGLDGPQLIAKIKDDRRRLPPFSSRAKFAFTIMLPRPTFS